MTREESPVDCEIIQHDPTQYNTTQYNTIQYNTTGCLREIEIDLLLKTTLSRFPFIGISPAQREHFVKTKTKNISIDKWACFHPI